MNHRAEFSKMAKSTEEIQLIKTNSLLKEKMKNQQIKQQAQKREFYHQQERHILKKQVDEYRDTFQAQHNLIEELQRKLNSKEHECQTLAEANSQLMQHNLSSFFTKPDTFESFQNQHYI